MRVATIGLSIGVYAAMVAVVAWWNLRTKGPIGPEASSPFEGGL